MVKKLREGETIFLAPEISGELDEYGKPRIHDNRSDKSLDVSSIDDKIIIYERQVKEWFIIPSQSISLHEDKHFIVLMVICSYVEGFIQNYQGKSSKSSSKTMFVKGFKLIFDEQVSKKNIEAFHDHARCGLFHDGMTKGKIILESGCEGCNNRAFDFSDPDVIRVYPEVAIRAIDRHFDSYLSDLRNPSKTTLRENFDRIFKIEGVGS